MARSRRDGRRASSTTSARIVYQHGGCVETSRLVHLYDLGEEYDKLVNLEGPAREVIRSHGEVRCYYPDVQARARRAAHVPQRVSVAVAAAAEGARRFLRFPQGRRPMRVAGLDTQAWVFEPKDGLRLRPQVLDRRRDRAHRSRRASSTSATSVLEQFVFTEVTIGAKIDPQMVKPTWPPAPPGMEGPAARAEAESRTEETGWTVTPDAARDSSKIVDGFRRVQGTREGRAPRLFGRPRRRLGVRRARTRGAAVPNGFSAAERAQRLQSASRRQSRDRARARRPRSRCARSPIPWRAASSAPAA